MSTFGGFPKEAYTFFRQLKKNNNRDWFQERKEVFEGKVKAPMVELVDAINTELASFAPAYVTPSSRAIFRIYRDTRFAADKTPYKTHIAATFPHRVMGRHHGACFYLHVCPEEVGVAGGIYMPGPEQLLAVRRLIADRHQDFQGLVGNKELRSLAGEIQGEALTRVPKGFPATHPAEQLLRKKQWYFWRDFDPEIALTSKFLPEVVKRFKVMYPTVEFLNSTLLDQKEKQTSRLML